MKRILIVGNLGYVGPVLVKHLVSKKFIVDGLDTGFFLSNLTTNDSSEVFLRKQIFKDVRNIEKNDLIGYDGLIYLAAISNDPMGQAFKIQTMDINFKSAVAVAKLSKKVGVKSFLFASSCSVYGDSDQEIKSESSSLNPPLTENESTICRIALCSTGSKCSIKGKISAQCFFPWYLLSLRSLKSCSVFI